MYKVLTIQFLELFKTRAEKKELAKREIIKKTNKKKSDKGMLEKKK